MTTYTITDQITGRTAEVESYDIAETITPWYPEATDEITDAIAALESTVRRGEYTGELESFLQVTVS